MGHNEFHRTADPTDALDHIHDEKRTSSPIPHDVLHVPSGLGNSNHPCLYHHQRDSRVSDLPIRHGPDHVRLPSRDGHPSQRDDPAKELEL